MRTIDAYIRDPKTGGEYFPSPKQFEAHKHPARFKLYGGAMGGGKSVWLCASIKNACMKWPGSRWYLSRKEAVALKKTTLKTWEAMLHPGLIQRHAKTDCCYIFHGGSEVWYGGLGEESDKDKIKSMELTGFAIDEASEVDESFFLMLASRLRLAVPGVRYQGLMASNPEPGWLRSRFIDQAKPDHVFIPALPSDNPHLSPEYESGLRELYKGNPAWAKAYLDGDWDAFTGKNFVLAYTDIKSATERVFDTVRGDECIGVDVARYGDDETVLIHRHGPKVTEIEVYEKQDIVATAGRVMQMHERHPKSTINVDAGGIGGGVIDILNSNGCYANEVHFGGTPYDKEHFSDWASEAMAGTLEARFREGDIQLPVDDVLSAQLSARKYGFTKKGQVKIESKDEMKKRGLQSPDRADALMLAFAPNYNRVETVRLP